MFDLSKIEAAVNAISAEKKIAKEKLVEIIEHAIKTAYKKDYASKEANVNVQLDMSTGNVEISIEKTIVEEVTDPNIEMSYDDVGGAESGFAIGDTVEIDVSDEILGSEGFGRIASQAAKQVIVQKIQETEKEKLYHLFKDKKIRSWISVSNSSRKIVWYLTIMATKSSSQRVNRTQRINILQVSACTSMFAR
jgi:N utilization substance protein A